MFTAKEYAIPANIDDAYKALMARNNNYIVGGCAWLRMGNRRMTTAVDLSACGLDFITETEDTIEIGSMTSYRKVETSPILRNYFNGCVARCVEPIIGTQFRNTVTVGGSVFGRYGFSDFLPMLLALDATVVLYKAGEVPLSEFMNMSYKQRDIIVKIVIKKTDAKASYQHFRNSQSDFPVVNLALVKDGDQCVVTVGARSAKAIVAPETSAYLSQADWSDVDMVVAKAQELIEEVPFTSNMRASKEYRLHICKILLKRAIKEVASC